MKKTILLAFMLAVISMLTVNAFAGDNLEKAGSYGKEAVIDNLSQINPVAAAAAPDRKETTTVKVQSVKRSNSGSYGEKASLDNVEN
ncbi:MAG: hypothetical protein H7844_03075 [Nitrospirae bacterium YQR-1]